MTGRDETRPDDRALLRSHLRDAMRRNAFGVLMGGLVDGDELVITELVGTRTDSLHRLQVLPGEGVGGGAMASGRPTRVLDYVSSAHISHHHDEAVRREGLHAMLAVPIMLDGRMRAVLYAATRERGMLGDRALDAVTREARVIAGELRVRDEVDRRISILRGSEPLLPAPAESGDRLRETVREAHGDLLALARTMQDAELAARLREITGRLVGHADAPVDSTALTPRQLDVLSQIALGCSYPEAARRLGLQASTVKSYMQDIVRALGVHSRHEAVVAARRRGMLP
ncbi:MAG: GAF domain-containing protein [Actinobacteria bacterium]|nr:GAF domain-containing protein [Actinomycetota bacterium]